MRLQNIFGNKQAPSRDIANHFAVVEHLRYICNGGIYNNGEKLNICVMPACSICQLDVRLIRTLNFHQDRHTDAYIYIFNTGVVKAFKFSTTHIKFRVFLTQYQARFSKPTKKFISQAQQEW